MGIDWQRLLGAFTTRFRRFAWRFFIEKSGQRVFFVEKQSPTVPKGAPS
jgi:hypothetical protein